MKKLITTTAIAALSLGLPALAQAQSYYGETYNAHEACKKNEDKRQIIGGVAGAVLGGIVGSQVSANGARSEGSAIGALAGGIAGIGLADKSVDCDPVYETPRYGDTSSYGSSYGSGSSSYGSTYNTSYGSQPVYNDAVTYSSHPVYSQPSYGAGAVQYGSTYNTGTVSYPPYQTQQAPTYSGQSYTVSQPSYQTQTYPSYQTQSYQTQSYQTGAPAPTYHTTTYSRPVSYSTNSYGSRHQHGSYACTAHH